MDLSKGVRSPHAVSRLAWLFVAWLVLLAASLLIGGVARGVELVPGMQGPVALMDSKSADQDQVFRDAFDSMGSIPWYDAEADAVDAVPVAPRIDDSSNRDSRWNPSNRQIVLPNGPARPKYEPPKSLWQQLMTHFPTIIRWGFGILLFVLVVLLLAFALTRMERTATGKSLGKSQENPDNSEMEVERERRENLPVQVRSKQGDLLAEADRLRALGRYDEALIYLFGHRLIQLDRFHAIRLSRGKTNRQYLNELKPKPDLLQPMRITVDAFEKSYFGRYQVTESQFDHVRGLQDTFDACLLNSREAA